MESLLVQRINFRTKGFEKKAIAMLEKCIELNSGEAVFYYMKALWMYHHSILGMMALGKLGSQEKKVSIMFALQNVEMALQLDPNWEEPRKLKKTLLKV